MDSGMLSEALDLALQATQQDPSNLDGFVIASCVLNQQGRYEAVRAQVEKQIQLLSHPEHRTEPANFLTVSYQVGSDGELRGKVCKAIEGNIEFWDLRGARVDGWVHTIAVELSTWKRFGTVFVVQRWLLRNLGFTGQNLRSARKLVFTAAGSPAGVEPLRRELEELARWISGEDKSDDSSMSQYAEKRRPLAALVLAEEIYGLLGTKRRLIPEFLQRLKTTNFENNCEKLEQDLGELREWSVQGDFAPDAFPRVQQEVAEMYSASQQVIQEHVYGKAKTAADAKRRVTHGCLTGFVAWIVLCLAGAFVPLLLNGYIPRNTNPTTAFGALLGAILFGMASKSVERSFRDYRAMRDALAEAITSTNRRFGELGLPTIPAPALKVHPPGLSIVVYTVLLCSYFGWWLHAIVPSSVPNEAARPSQGSVPDSQIQPNPSPTAGELQIDGASAVRPLQTQTIIVTGHGLGQRYAYSGDSDFLQISDLTRNWNAGWSRDPGTDKVGLNVTSWTDTKIVIEGFTGVYGTDQNVLREGDNIRFRVWNPQTREGPAIYTSAVSGTATRNAGTLSSETE